MSFYRRICPLAISNPPSPLWHHLFSLLKRKMAPCDLSKTTELSIPLQLRIGIHFLSSLNLFINCVVPSTLLSWMYVGDTTTCELKKGMNGKQPFGQIEDYLSP